MSLCGSVLGTAIIQRVKVSRCLIKVKDVGLIEYTSAATARDMAGYSILGRCYVVYHEIIIYWCLKSSNITPLRLSCLFWVLVLSSGPYLAHACYLTMNTWYDFCFNFDNCIYVLDPSSSEGQIQSGKQQPLYTHVHLPPPKPPFSASVVTLLSKSFALA